MTQSYDQELKRTIHRINRTSGRVDGLPAVSMKALVRCAGLMGHALEAKDLQECPVLCTRYERAVLRLLARTERVDDGSNAGTAVYRTPTGTRVLLVCHDVVVTVMGADPRRPIGRVRAGRLARKQDTRTLLLGLSPARPAERPLSLDEVERRASEEPVSPRRAMGRGTQQR